MLTAYAFSYSHYILYQAIIVTLPVAIAVAVNVIMIVVSNRHSYS